MDRNFICCQKFGDMFQLYELVNYLSLNDEFLKQEKEKIDVNLKASFCQLIANIYINKEPRTSESFPKLIRIVQLDDSGR